MVSTKDLEGNLRRLFSGTVLAFVWRELRTIENSSAREATDRSGTE
jgi:hypothetical protein